MPVGLHRWWVAGSNPVVLSEDVAQWVERLCLTNTCRRTFVGSCKEVIWQWKGNDVIFFHGVYPWFCLADKQFQQPNDTLLNLLSLSSHTQLSAITPMDTKLLKA